MTVVDAHHHYWRIGARPRTPAHDYEPEHLRGELRTAGVTATVLVQSADEPAENDRLRAYQSATPTVAGVVAWLPLRDPTAARRELDRIDGMPRLSGVRCLVGREPLDWLAGPDVRALFGELADRGLAWDVVAVTAPARSRPSASSRRPCRGCESSSTTSRARRWTARPGSRGPAASERSPPARASRSSSRWASTC